MRHHPAQLNEHHTYKLLRPRTQTWRFSIQILVKDILTSTPPLPPITVTLDVEGQTQVELNRHWYAVTSYVKSVKS